MYYFLDCQQKDKKYNAINVKKISNESILDQPHASSVTLFKDANQIGIRKHKTFAKEEDIKTMMDILPIDSDVKNLLYLQQYETDVTLKFKYFVYFAGQQLGNARKA